MHLSLYTQSIVFLLVTLVVCLVPTASALSVTTEAVSRTPNNQIIVQYASSAPSARVQGVAELAADTSQESIINSLFVEHDIVALPVQSEVLDDEGRTQVLTFDDHVDTAEIITSVQNLPGVISVQPNFTYYTQVTAPDPLTDHANNWPLAFLELNEAYDRISEFLPTDRVPRIGIIDTNIKTSHPDLQEKLWQPETCLDDIGNNFRDGCPKGGFNVIEEGEIRKLSNDPESGFSWHGTSVSGVAIAGYQNGIGANGVARSSKLVALAAPVDSQLPYLINNIRTADAVRLIAAARHNEVEVLSISWGTLYTEQEDGVIDCSTTEGKQHAGFDNALYSALRDFPGVVFTASGNNAKQTGRTAVRFTPADYAATITDASGNECWRALENIIPVGGVDRNSNIYSSMNYGQHVAVLAPAVAVIVPSYKNTYTGSIATTWTTTTDTENNRQYVSPIPSAGSYNTESSYTIGPIDLSSVDADRGEGVVVAFPIECPAEYNNLAIQASIDGQEYGTINLASHDEEVLFFISGQNSRMLPSAFLTDKLHLNIVWRGSETSGLKPSDCRVFTDEGAFVFFVGSLRSGISHEKQMELGYYQSTGGTSIAAAVAAGVAAILLETNPDLDAAAVRRLLIAGTTSLSSDSYTIAGQTVSDTAISSGGIVNALGSINALAEEFPELLASVIPDTPELAADTDSGASDGITKHTTISVTGTASADAALTVVAEKTVGTTGYTIENTTTASASDGSYTTALVLPQATDTDGNLISQDALSGDWSVTVSQQQSGRVHISDPSEPLVVVVDTVSPVLESVTVLDADITLTYTESLTPALVPQAAALSVMVNGAPRIVTDVQVSDNTVQSTLESEVTPDDVVTLGYVNPLTRADFDVSVDDAGRIADLAENDAANIDTRAVVNETTAETALSAPTLSDETNSGATDDMHTNRTTLLISGSAPADATVVVTAAQTVGGVEYVAAAEVTLAADQTTYTASLDVTTATETGGGRINPDAVSGVWQIVAKQRFNNDTLSPASPVLMITIDTLSPRITEPPALLGTASDGYLNANEAAGTDPIVSAAVFEDADDTLSVAYAVSVSGADEQCAAASTYTVTDPTTITPLSLTDDGRYHICVRVTDRADNTSFGNPVLLVRDTTAPAFIANNVSVSSSRSPSVRIRINHNQTDSESLHIGVEGDGCSALSVRGSFTGSSIAEYTVSFSGSRKRYENCRLTLRDTAGNSASEPLTLSVFSIRRSGGGGGGGGGSRLVPALPTDTPAPSQLTPVLESSPVENFSPGEIAPVTTAAVVETTVPQSELRIGSRGSEVRQLQQLLNTHGYPVATTGPGSPGNETDYFGPATKRAVMALQRAQGIEPTGNYDLATREALQRLEVASMTEEQMRQARIQALLITIQEIRERIDALLRARGQQ